MGEAAAIRELGGVILYTEHFEPMRAFYVETLGLRPRGEHREAHVDFVNFAWGDVRLTITTHADVRGRNADPQRIMLNLSVDDIGAVYGRLRKVGVEFSRPPEQEEFGGWIATFADPDGNTLQLLQERPEPRPAR